MIQRPSPCALRCPGIAILLITAGCATSQEWALSASTPPQDLAQSALIARTGYAPHPRTPLQLLPTAELKLGPQLLAATAGAELRLRPRSNASPFIAALGVDLLQLGCASPRCFVGASGVSLEVGVIAVARHHGDFAIILTLDEDVRFGPAHQHTLQFGVRWLPDTQHTNQRSLRHQARYSLDETLPRGHFFNTWRASP